ncbi:MAG: ABC transporter ATP-binding protein [Clostridium sp.]|nr:ABC transporter ATP-binding protein [Clostridium sp.]
MENIIKIKEIVKSYGVGEGIVHALDGVDLEIAAGELVAVVGVSGSGKSTLLHIIGGMDSPTAGSVFFNGKDISKYSKKQKAKYRCENVGIVFQNFKLIEELNVRENIIMPVLIARKKVDEDYYNALVEMLGLSERQSHLPSELSGGQKQRVAIARALINKPELLLADEPTGNLDKKNSQEIMQIFLEIHRKGKTIVLVTHDREIADQCQRQIEMSDGKIC